MSQWSVTDVVHWLKTLGVSREALIFVYRHNVDGTIMDESVELLVKDFELNDPILELEIVSKWKANSLNGGTLAEELMKLDTYQGSTASQPLSAAKPTMVTGNNDEGDQSLVSDETALLKAKLVETTYSILSKESGEDATQDAPHSRIGKTNEIEAQNEEPLNNSISEPKEEFSHPKAIAWSRSGKHFVPLTHDDDEDITTTPSKTGEITLAQSGDSKKQNANFIENSQNNTKTEQAAEEEYTNEVWESEPAAEEEGARAAAQVRRGSHRSTPHLDPVPEIEEEPNCGSGLDQPSKADDFSIPDEAELAERSAVKDRSSTQSQQQQQPQQQSQPSSTVPTDSSTAGIEMIKKYQQEMAKQAELLRVQQEQIALQRQLIEQQRLDLGEVTSSSSSRMAKNTSYLRSQPKGDKNMHESADTALRANTNYELGDLDQAEPFYADDLDLYYAQQNLPNHVLTHDNISMLSDSGVFDAYQNNVPFPGLFVPESSITSASSADYNHHGEYSPYIDHSPTPRDSRQRYLRPSRAQDDLQQEFTQRRPFDTTRGFNDLEPEQHSPPPRLSPSDGGDHERNHATPALSDDNDNNGHGEPSRQAFKSKPVTNKYPQQRGDRAPAYDFSQLAQGSTDSIGNTWFRAQPSERPASRSFVPSLDLAAVREQSSSLAQEYALSSPRIETTTQGPESTSPMTSPRVPYADLADIMAVLKELTATNAALTEALRPNSGHSGMHRLSLRARPPAVRTDSAGSGRPRQEDTGGPGTSRSAPGTTGTAARNPRAAARAAREPQRKETVEEATDMLGRPPWYERIESTPRQLDSARQVHTARTERTDLTGSRPPTRESSSALGARILRDSAPARPRSKNSARVQAKPRLQDYIDLLAQQFAARPLCQAPYYDTNVVYNFQQNNQLDLHPHPSTHNHPPKVRDYILSEVLTDTILHAGPQTAPAFPPLGNSDGRKGGVFVLDQLPTELAYDGPRYGAPVLRISKDGTNIGPLYAPKSPPARATGQPRPSTSGNSSSSSRPGRSAARPSTAVGTTTATTTVPATGTATTSTSATTTAVAPPPVTSRPSKRPHNTHTHSKARSIAIVATAT